MTIQQLVAQYQTISQVLNEKWPLQSKDQRIFARTMKIVEELGELSDEILTSMSLQRDDKVKKFVQKNVDDEFADVLGSLILLGIELDIDVVEVMERKLDLTRKRFEITRDDLKSINS